MARHDPHDHARRKGTARKGDDDGLPGHRPHGRLAAHRPPGGCDDPQALPAVRTPPAGPRGRCYGHDRRPLGQVAGAQPARRRDAAPQPGGDQAAAGQAARLRLRRPERRTAGEQLRLDEGLYVPGLHPRHRQVHHGQLHDGQGFGQEALQRRGRRHVVHGVHLPARTGLRLPAPLRDDELQDPAGRRRPARSSSAASWAPRPRPTPSPARSSRRPTVRSSARPRAATSGSTRATRRPTGSTSSGSTSATRMPSATSRSSRCSTARRSRGSSPSTRRRRTCAFFRSGWPRRSPR